MWVVRPAFISLAFQSVINYISDPFCLISLSLEILSLCCLRIGRHLEGAGRNTVLSESIPCFLGPLILCGQARTPASKFGGPMVLLKFSWLLQTWQSFLAQHLSLPLNPICWAWKAQGQSWQDMGSVQEALHLGDLRHRGPSSSGALNRLPACSGLWTCFIYSFPSWECWSALSCLSQPEAGSSEPVFWSTFAWPPNP